MRHRANYSVRYYTFRGFAVLRSQVSWPSVGLAGIHPMRAAAVADARFQRPGLFDGRTNLRIACLSGGCQLIRAKAGEVAADRWRGGGGRGRACPGARRPRRPLEAWRGRVCARLRSASDAERLTARTGNNVVFYRISANRGSRTIDCASPTRVGAPRSSVGAPRSTVGGARTGERAPITGEPAPLTGVGAVLTHESASPTHESASPTHESAPLTGESAPPTHERASPTPVGAVRAGVIAARLSDSAARSVGDAAVLGG